MIKLTKTMEEWIDELGDCSDCRHEIEVKHYTITKEEFTQAMQAAYAEGREDAIEEAAKIYNPYIEEHNPESNICPCCVFDEVIQSIQSLKQTYER